ncbi:MAG: YceH family protein [Nitrospirae bacterium]|nr:YceH family protein [Nitrospirota bacterium]
MGIILNDIELRILGSLIEKERTTPDYYPMTLNALINACNQKSNRDPIVSFDESTVARVLDELQKKRLAEKIYKADSRVPKYEHNFKKVFDVSDSELAVMCELLLRGAQTIGEIRNRAERMHKFEGIQEVDTILNGLMGRQEPLVLKLPRQTGHKECRFMHLLSGKPVIHETGPGILCETPAPDENERITKLENDLSLLRREMDELRQDFISLKSQLE